MNIEFKPIKYVKCCECKELIRETEECYTYGNFDENGFHVKEIYCSDCVGDRP